MKERIMQIISRIAEKMLDGEAVVDVKSLINDLVEAGYTMGEIDAAFALIFTLPDSLVAEGEFDRSSKALRVFNPGERSKLALSAQGYLLELMEDGLLTRAEIEALVHAAMQLEAAEVGVSELRWLLSKIVNDTRYSLLADDASVEAGNPEGEYH